MASQLYMCFEANKKGGRDDDDGGDFSYLMLSVELRSLLSNQKEQPPEVKILDTLDGHDVCTSMGCGQFGTSKIMLVGGVKPSICRGEDGRHHREYSESLSDKVFEFNTSHCCPSFKNVSRMLSGKANPLVVELNNLLFVLDGSLCSGASITPFETYNPCTKQWNEITMPECFTDNCFPYFCYFVTDDSEIVVGSHPDIAQFGFNVNTSKWKISPALPDTQRPDLGIGKAAVLNFQEEFVLITFNDGFLSVHVIPRRSHMREYYSYKNVIQVTPPEYFRGCLTDLQDNQRVCLVTAPELKNSLNSDVYVVTFKVNRRSLIANCIEILSTYKYDRSLLLLSSSTTPPPPPPVLSNKQIWRTVGCFKL